MTAIYARCCEPTGVRQGIVRDGCGWTGEVERVASGFCSAHHKDEADPKCSVCYPEERVFEKAAGRGSLLSSQAASRDGNQGTDVITPQPSEITHDGEGRWPYDIDQCPACGGSIEIEKED